MSSELAIRARALGKTYQLFRRPQDRLRQLLGSRKRLAHEREALCDVSFDIERGETVGIVGPNGSGKSTLLQLVAGTLSATTGTCDVAGRVAALLELGPGFNPDFTGRENVYVNAAILGIPRRQMAARYEEIVAFADLGDLMDQPVRAYSTGAYLRLAFAIAVSVAPDVLLVDEVLVVGDIRFQARCIERMREIQRQGTTILFVSHATELVRRFCHRCLWLESGRLVMNGDVATVTDRYVDRMTASNGHANGAPPPARFAGQGALAHVVSVEVSDAVVPHNAPLRVTVEYEVHDPALTTFLVGVALYAADRRYVFGPNTALDGVTAPSTPGRHRVAYVIPRLPLLGGTYTLDVGLFLDRGLVCLDYRSEAAGFEVEAPYVAEGLIHIDHRWEVGG